MKKPKLRWYRFWIKSSRGTNAQTFVQLPHHMDGEDVKAKLERWCSSFGAWEASENHIEYGFEKVRKPPASWKK